MIWHQRDVKNYNKISILYIGVNGIKEIDRNLAFVPPAQWCLALEVEIQ